MGLVLLKIGLFYNPMTIKLKYYLLLFSTLIGGIYLGFLIETDYPGLKYLLFLSFALFFFVIRKYKCPNCGSSVTLGIDRTGFLMGKKGGFIVTGIIGNACVRCGFKYTWF